MRKIYNGFLFQKGTTHLLASRRAHFRKNNFALKNIEIYDNNGQFVKGEGRNPLMYVMKIYK